MIQLLFKALTLSFRDNDTITHYPDLLSLNLEEPCNGVVATFLKEVQDRLWSHPIKDLKPQNPTGIKLQLIITVTDGAKGYNFAGCIFAIGKLTETYKPKYLNRTHQIGCDKVYVPILYAKTRGTGMGTTLLKALQVAAETAYAESDFESGRGYHRVIK